MFSLFNGIIRPYASLPVFWRYWMYWINPSTYWIGGVLSAILVDVPVRCAPGEATQFNPPPGQTCQQYAGPYVQSIGAGYLTDPKATAECGYCPYANGAEYLRTLGVSPDEKWRDFGIFLLFCWSNLLLVYFFIYTVRVRGWTFGFGPLFHGLGKVVTMVEKTVTRKEKKKKKKSKKKENEGEEGEEGEERSLDMGRE